MNCPACKATLAAAELPAAPAQNLTALRCPACGGQWVDGATYLLWAQRQAAALPPRPHPGAAAPADDGDPADPAAQPRPPAPPKKARLCPNCGRILTRARVGHGVAFQIERCGGCAGFWFDAGEWDALLARGLHGCAHHVFSDAWQADVTRHKRQAQHARLMAAKLGAADYAEIRRVKAWIDAHPHRAELHAILRDE